MAIRIEPRQVCGRYSHVWRETHSVAIQDGTEVRKICEVCGVRGIFRYRIYGSFGPDVRKGG